MIDIHCHILPNIDDGAANIDDTLAMANIAANCGVRAIIATPHCNVPNEPPNYFDSDFRDIFMNVRKTIAEERIPVKLLSGMEVFLTYDLPDLIKQGKILTLNQSNYLLTEFDFNEDPDFVEIMVKRLRDMKLTPVIAHPERYGFIKDNPDAAKELIEKGCVIQLNKGSFLGRYGSSAQKTAFELLEKGFVDIVSSDAHNPTIRTPYMTEAWHTLQGLCDTNLLFKVNPYKICTNTPIR